MSDKRFSVLIAALALSVSAACAPSERDADVAMASHVGVEDAWAKAADSGMTAVFGTLTNSGGANVHIVGAESPAAARVEIHETTRGKDGTSTMRPKADGIAIAPGNSHELVPGGDHLMLMDLTGPLRPGTDVEVTVAFEDGSTLPVTAQIRDFAGADEEYPSDDHQHDHG